MHIISIIISFDMMVTKLLYDEMFDINLMFSLQKYNNKFESATKKSFLESNSLEIEPAARGESFLMLFLRARKQKIAQFFCRIKK